MCIRDRAKGSLWAPTAAIVNPWEFGLARAEVAVQNGCELRRRFPVEQIEKTAEGYACLLYTSPLEIFVNEVCMEKVMPSVRLPVFHSL